MIYYVFILCTLVSCMSVWGVRFPGTGVPDSWELQCRCWELNMGPLEEQPAILPTELSLHPQLFFIYGEIYRHEITIFGCGVKVKCIMLQIHACCWFLEHSLVPKEKLCSHQTTAATFFSFLRPWQLCFMNWPNIGASSKWYKVYGLFCLESAYRAAE